MTARHGASRLGVIEPVAATDAASKDYVDTNSGTSTATGGRYTTAIGDGSDTSIVVTHGLNTRAVEVSLYDAATYEEVNCDKFRTTVNTVTLEFDDPPATNEFVVVVTAGGIADLARAPWINVKDHGAIGDGIVDDTAAVLAAFAAIPSDGACVYFPPGIYLCNTVAADVVLLLINKYNVTLRGAGKSSILRTSSATATEFLRIDTCTQFSMEDLQVEVRGTANLDKVVHYTCASPGSVHDGRFENLLIHNNSSGTVRNVFDGMTTSGSNIIYSGMAAFAAGDVGAAITIAYGNTTPFRSTISTVQTLSSTLAAGINSSTTTVTLNSALSGMPASGWSLKVGTEHMMVTAGGNTTTLTVIRGRGNDLHTASHSSGATAVVYKATLADNVPFTTDEPAGMFRIDPKTAHYNYGLAIGLDHPGASNMDIADTLLFGVTVSGAAIAGFAVGNGTWGNILEQFGFGVSASYCAYGFFFNGGVMSIRSANMGYNLIDFKRATMVSQPTIIDDVRSEHSGMSYESTGGVAGGPHTTLSNWEMSVIYAENYVQLAHRVSSPIELHNLNFTVSAVTQSVTQLVFVGNSTNKGSLIASNVSHNGQNTDPFVTVDTNRIIMGVPQRAATGEVIAHPAVSGAVLTSDGTQVVTGKTMSGSNNTFSNISADSTVDGSANHVFTAADDTKLGGIATGATANSPDATLLARANHTGTQLSSTISDLAEAIRDTIGTALLEGAGIDITVNDGADTITIAAVGGVPPRTVTVTSSATPAINVGTTDVALLVLAHTVTSMSSGVTGTPADGQRLLLRIKDDGTPRGITWGTLWRAIGVTLPTTTVVGKIIYIGAIYNLADTKWDVVAVGQEA